MRLFELHRSVRVRRPIDEVFEFFSRPENLERITAPFLRFEILSELPVTMKVGAKIDYRLRIRGVPLRWRSEITTWDPPRCFVDEQLRGPYRLWIHEHGFEASSEGTIVSDHVRYRPIGGWVVDRLFVRRDVSRIFEYRERRLMEIFADSDSSLHGPHSGCRGANGPAG